MKHCLNIKQLCSCEKLQIIHYTISYTISDKLLKLLKKMPKSIKNKK